ncbi:hypothetical protein E8D34_16195 [Nocardioides sp. GY 10113]|uniref:hypothetical protein n=1 Tax=Nocardioides sp. GY 10113 TaxID=2569761 RepID=UPI0010A7DCAD|nr:hypothetical protein [Nocardioides sp. GY 10113]TIC83246.1 hypothetical protein E8D34_16195 [Nocardioides sp. GY 10113]
MRGAPAGVVVALVMLATALLRVPMLDARLGSDEGGFLMVAGQWDPGRSLYGDYWVDRPPLIIGIFQIADALGGGAVALRLLGLTCAVASVGLAAVLGRLVAPDRRWAPVVAAATASVFLLSPLFGAFEVNGELLASPFVLGGLAAVLRAARSGRTATALAWWTVAGAAGAAAASTKQSMLDVAAAAGVVVLIHLARRRWRAAAVAVAGFGAGAAGLLALLLTWARAEGTSVRGLYGAVVTFRFDASAVISQSASAATSHRALAITASFLASGAVLLLLVAAFPSLRLARPRRWFEAARADPVASGVTAAVVGWELAAVVAGGSYWHHYLLGTVPGVVLATALALQHRPRRTRWVAAVLAYSALVTAVTLTIVVPSASSATSETQVARYLATHSGPGDTGVVAFGAPVILREAGLASPYPNLWSLPARVRDPDLRHFARVLRSRERPTWVVVAGASLGTWGIDARRAEPALARRYTLVHVIGDWHVYRENAPDRGVR